MIDPDFNPDFNPREISILKGIAEGLSNQEIADAIFTTKKTVGIGVSDIYSKLGFENKHSHIGVRVQVAIWYREKNAS